MRVLNAAILKGKSDMHRRSLLLRDFDNLTFCLTEVEKWQLVNWILTGYLTIGISANP